MEKAIRKLLSVLLSVAMLLSLVPGIGLTASAVSVAEEWTTDITVTETRTINGNVLADLDITLTIAEGVTLTVNGRVIASGMTLTAAGGGTLVVNGVNGPNGTDHDPVGGVYNGTAGYSGGPGISGNIYVAGASVVVNGGNGGNGGSSETDGAAGGNGGNAIDGDVTLESGSITATGGRGGSGGIILMGGSGANGSDGKAVTGSISVTGTGATVQESDNDTDWSYVSGGSSDKRFIHGEVPAPAPAPAVSFVKVTDADQIAVDNIGECTFDEAKAWVYDNWDAVTDGVDPATGIDIVYAGNGESNLVNYISLYLATYPTKDDFDAGYSSASGTNVDNVKDWYTNFGEIVYICEKPAAPAVSFVKVTDADQIAVDNIGECTFDEAKAWVYDNWDAVTNGVDPSNIIDFVYIVNGSARVIYFSTGDYADKDEFKDRTHTDSSAGLTAIKSYYNSGSDVVYVCSKAAAPAPSAYADYLPAATDDATALAAKVVKFDDKDWYLIEDNSTAADAGTVTLLSKECVGASKFGTNNTYSGSTVETYVNNWYTSNISADAKAAVNGNGMFLLTSDQASALSSGVRKCSEASGADTNLWWLCTPFSYYLEVMCVDGDYGVVRDGVDDGTNVNNTLGVRPALQLDLSKVTFDGATNTFALPAHVHSLTPHAAENAGCTTAGNSAYWSCSCGMYFSDENGETEIAENSWVIPALGHNYDNVAYSSDELYHWKVCSRCDEDSPHDYHTWGVATYTWSGDNSTVTASHVCTTCGKQVSETVNTTSIVTADATCTTKELTTFIALFMKPEFYMQTKEDVETGPALGHDFSYEASGDTVTATCERAGCGYHTNVTITAPALTVYGGAESAAATFEGLDAFNAATGKSVAVTDVKYVGRDGTVYAESATAPTGAGKYTAKITVEGATASVNYEIAKTGSSAATVAAIEWTFDGTAHALLTVTGEAAGGTMKYALGTAAAPGTFGDSIPEATDPDTYYVWYKVAGDANHNNTDAVLVTVVVAHDEALDAVIAAIDAIGPVTEVLADQKAKIDAARAGYEDLTPAQQALVTNYATLVDAEADYKALFVYSASTQITVSGTERIGETLTAAATDIPAFITDSIVRWYNEDGDLLGTGDTYVIAESQIGKTIRAELYSAEANDTVTSDFTGLIGKGVIKNYTLPTAAHIMYPQTLGDATLTGGDTGAVEGVWAWATPDAQPTSAQSGSSFELTFTPTGVYADLYEGITTRLAVIVEPAPFEPQAVEDPVSGLVLEAEFAQNVELGLTDIPYSQSAYLALLRASARDDSGLGKFVMLKTIDFTINGEAVDEAYQGAVTVKSYVGERFAGNDYSVWFFIDGAPVNYVGTVGYDGVLVIENVAL